VRAAIAAAWLAVPALLAAPDVSGATMSDIVSPDAPLERVGGRFKLGESPLWRPDGTVLVSDIIANVIWSVDARTGATTPYRSPSRWANGQIEYLDGTILTAEHAGAISQTTADGRRIVRLERYMGKRLNSPNDLVTSAKGVVYFSDPTFGFMAPMGPPGRPEPSSSCARLWRPRAPSTPIRPSAIRRRPPPPSSPRSGRETPALFAP
jgi:sugar lactone lactonase YvrE